MKPDFFPLFAALFLIACFIGGILIDTVGCWLMPGACP